jgi:hypothetical protein
MTPMQVAGLALIAVGVLDPILGFFVIGPRIADPDKRRVLVATLAGSGALMLVIGALLVAGKMPGLSG